MSQRFYLSLTKNEVINSFRVTKDAIYVSTTKYGIEGFYMKLKTIK